ncbi:diguanylate cyclase domain-containing protein [Pseudomonas sp. NA-150]|uniref:GGDEF domain-containing protein n=1 Tax=Pseudomonas sp. NA-150 TaxID=3367525 RepID=UPI0037C87ED5
MRHLPSLRSRFALLIAVLVSLLSWGLGSLISHDSSTRMRSEIGMDLAEVSYQMIDRLDRDMANRAHILTVLSHLQVLRQPDDVGKVRELLNHLQLEFPEIAWIGLTDMTGVVKASSNGVLEGASLAERPVFLQGREHLSVGDVHDAKLLATLLPSPSGEALKFVDISVPVLNDQHVTVAVLAAHMSWAWADDLRKALADPSEVRHKVEFFVLSADHKVLLGPREMLGQPLPLPLLDRVTRHRPQWDVQQWPDGDEYLIGVATSRGYNDYPGLGWTVVARQPLEEAYAPAHQLQRDILAWGVALAVLVAYIGWLLASWYTRPLWHIAKAADRLSAGEILEIPDLKGTREIAQLSQSIRHLVASLSNQQTALGVMESLAHHDPLTGLPNRAALEKYLPRAQQRSQNVGTCLALLYLDLDGFKPINDEFGHTGGDELLREIAARLRSCLREGDIVARLGGDEFLMVLQVTREDATGQSQAIAHRVLKTLAHPVKLGNRQAKVGCSVGGALWPLDDPDLNEVLELADQALYRAKHAGKQQAHFHISTLD